MNISVLIPTYNAERFIQATLDSVFCQTLEPKEILVLDDGSKDATMRLLDAYRPKVTIMRQENRGVASARNTLFQTARGDLIAFLDHDDVWHPKYLEAQGDMLKRHPEAVASFTGHINFRGYDTYSWSNPDLQIASPEVIQPLRFLEAYNRCPAPFGSMSFCCIRRSVLQQIGTKPFLVNAAGADDFGLMNLLPLIGPVVFSPARLVAYRQTESAQSSNRLRVVGLAVQVFESLAARYETLPNTALVRTFRSARASKRRHYSKHLMSIGKNAEARHQLLTAIAEKAGWGSFIKSLYLFFTTYLPRRLHRTRLVPRAQW